MPKFVYHTLRVFILFLCGLFVCSCKKNTPEKEEVLVKVIYDLINYDAVDIPNIEVVNSANKSCNLSELVTDDRLIFYLPDLGCSSCYEKELELLKEMIPERIKKRVLVIGAFTTNRELKLFENKSKLQTFRIVKTNNEFPIPVFNEVSLAFVLTKQMKCYALFDAVNNAKASKLYYRFISEKMSSIGHAK